MSSQDPHPEQDPPELRQDRRTAEVIVTGVTSIGRLAGYATAILILIGLSFGGLWNMTVHEPFQRLEKRVDKLEQGQDEAAKQIANMDKNVAVILERSARADASLESIRNFLENQYRRPAP